MKRCTNNEVNECHHKKNATTTPTTAATSRTSYRSTMTSNLASNTNSNIKRRESSTGEDSGVQIDPDSTGKAYLSSITTSTNLVSPLSSISKPINTITTAPKSRSGTASIAMVTSSTVIPPSMEAKLSPSSPSSSTTTLVSRMNSNASTSGTFSETSRSFGQEENSSDSLFGHPTPLTSSSHYVIKCNVNPKTSLSTSPMPLTPRVKVTVQQPSITALQPRYDSSSDNVSSSLVHLKTPKSNKLPIMTTSAPEFSLSGTSTVDDSDEVASYNQYLSPHGRQSNPSPELRKKTFNDWAKSKQRSLTRSKSEINTIPTEQSQQQLTTSQIKPVSKRV
ncbi:unnamed protein product [Rotaria magnacalcarata]